VGIGGIECLWLACLAFCNPKYYFYLQMQVFQLRDALAQKDKEIEELNNKLNSGVDLESRMAGMLK